jgi:hypothetical protein
VSRKLGVAVNHNERSSSRASGVILVSGVVQATHTLALFTVIPSCLLVEIVSLLLGEKHLGWVLNLEGRFFCFGRWLLPWSESSRSSFFADRRNLR